MRKLVGTTILLAIILALCDYLVAAKIIVFNATPVEITLKGHWDSSSETVVISPWGDGYIDNAFWELLFYVDDKDGGKIDWFDSYSVYFTKKYGISKRYTLWEDTPVRKRDEMRKAYQEESENFIFFADSDLHFGDEAQNRLKRANLDVMMKIDKETGGDEVKGLILCGDLVDWGDNDAQWKDFVSNYYNITRNKYIPVFSATGNHDVYGKRPNNVMNYIWRSISINRAALDAGISWPYEGHDSWPAGGYYNYFDIKGVRFFDCGICPGSASSIWFPHIADWLGADLLGISKDKPIVIFFHNNIFGGFSDWWTDKEKDYFYDKIKDYNVVAIFCGHNHTSEMSLWKDKIRVVRVGGDQFAKVTRTGGCFEIELVKPVSSAAYEVTERTDVELKASDCK